LSWRNALTIILAQGRRQASSGLNTIVLVTHFSVRNSRAGTIA
jgi:hypothetical protein